MTAIQCESLRSEMEKLTVPQGQVRHLRWIVDTLAVGRTSSGDYEIFICGPQLNATSSLARRRLQHGEWRPDSGDKSFAANRILLPEAPHFASIAALITIELMRARITQPPSLQRSFTDVEPIIEMAIRRGALPEAAIIGLIGELIVLRRLFLAQINGAATMMRALEFWQGWQEGRRDFRIGRHSIEVKATQASTSIHKFSGMHQLESKMLPSGEFEQIYLMSIGLAASNAIGENLPSLVSIILTLLSKVGAAQEVSGEFLRRVSLYGQSGTGYNHATMREWSVYGISYTPTFLPRLYRVDDPAMHLLDRDMLSKTFVQAEGLTFTMHIPEQVSPFNPAPSWEAELESMDTP
jgi:hypothetical protein